MKSVELNPIEVDGYKFACHMDAQNLSTAIPCGASIYAAGILHRRGVSGEVEKITVTFRGDGIPHLYQLFYS